ncbi:hypothetical protein Hanom_Chr09g00845891 [Helianthus anomalus]
MEMETLQRNNVGLRVIRRVGDLGKRDNRKMREMNIDYFSPRSIYPFPMFFQALLNDTLYLYYLFNKNNFKIPNNKIFYIFLILKYNFKTSFIRGSNKCDIKY